MNKRWGNDKCLRWVGNKGLLQSKCTPSGKPFLSITLKSGRVFPILEKRRFALSPLGKTIMLRFMLYLLLASLVWGLSFGLIKNYLTGLDPNLVAFLRLAAAMVLFTPYLLRQRTFSLGAILRLLSLGGLMYGLMYGLYNLSFRYLQSYQVALLTITTPLMVAGWSRVREGRQIGALWLPAVLAIAGAAVIVFRQGAWNSFVIGFLLLQACNACFAIGQVEYRKWRSSLKGMSDPQLFGWQMTGAVVIATFTTTFSGGWGDIREVSMMQLAVLLYLGVVATGMGFFWWNKGAVRVGPGTLAAMNNIKIPTAVLCSLLVFGESVDLMRLAVGGGLMAVAVWLTRR